MRHQKSRLPLSQNYHHPGCMWGLLQILDFHHRLHIRKMLMYRRNRDRPAGRSKIPKIEEDTLPCEDHICPDKDAGLQLTHIEGKLDARQRSSGRVRMRNLLLKRRSKDQDQMRHISPLAARLLRTISIHHMQSNAYVLPDELISASEISAVEDFSNEVDASSSKEHGKLWPKASKVILHNRCEECRTADSTDNAISEQLGEHGNDLLEKQSLVSEKLTEAKMALLKQKVSGDANQGNVAVYQSKEFIGMMELLSENRELLLKILQDPSFVLANYARTQQSSSPALSKCGSFPVSGLPNRKNEELFRLKQKKKQSESFVNQDTRLEAENSTSGPRTVEKCVQVEESISVSEVDIRNSETAPTDGAGTSTSFESLPVSKKHRHNGPISKRFKLIKQRIKDVIKENRREHHHISMDGILHKIPYGHKSSKNAMKEIQSLCEDDSKSKLSSKTFSFTKKNSSKSMRRSHSLIDSLDKYSRLLDTISSEKAKGIPETSKLMEGDRFEARESPKSLKRIFSLPELESYSLRDDVQSEEPIELPTTGVDVGNAPIDRHGSDEPKPDDGLMHREESIELEKSVEQRVAVNAGEIISGDPEHTVSTNDDDQCEACIIREDLLTEDISRISPQEQGVLENNQMIPQCTPSEELDYLTVPDSHLSGNMPDVVDVKDVTTGFTGITSVRIPVNARDEAEFNYVREILWKSGFSSEESLGAWYTPYQPMDPLLFDEVESSPRGHGGEGFESDISLDHQLLFDLINEVLLDIYDTCFAYCPWLPRFDSRVRPMPVGYHVLEEVWANISWYLSQTQLDPATECVVARDFAKPDGWMNVQADTEEIAFELEDLILDDLIDEIVLDNGAF